MVARKKSSVGIREREALLTNEKQEFIITLDKITEYIKTRAYYLWEELNKPQGKDLEIWRQAEKEILSKLIKR